MTGKYALHRAEARLDVFIKFVEEYEQPMRVKVEWNSKVEYPVRSLGFSS